MGDVLGLRRQVLGRGQLGPTVLSMYVLAKSIAFCVGDE